MAYISDKVHEPPGWFEKVKGSSGNKGEGKKTHCVRAACVRKEHRSDNGAGLTGSMTSILPVKISEASVADQQVCETGRESVGFAQRRRKRPEGK